MFTVHMLTVICNATICGATMCNATMCNATMCNATYSQRHHHLTVFAISVRMLLGVSERRHTNVDAQKIVTANHHAMRQQLRHQYCHEMWVKQPRQNGSGCF